MTGFLSSGSNGTVVRNMLLIRSSAELYPISVGVVRYDNIAIFFFIKFLMVCTAHCWTVGNKDCWLNVQSHMIEQTG